MGSNGEQLQLESPSPPHYHLRRAAKRHADTDGPCLGSPALPHTPLLLTK